MPLGEILTIEEVAEYLRVSERTVYDWAQKGEIPCGKLGTAWRFKREELERWVDQRLGSDPKKKPAPELDLSEILAVERVFLEPFQEKRAVLGMLVDALAATKEIRDRGELAVEIERREGLMSTGIGCGIGVPHVRLVSVQNPVMAVAVSRPGILDYESLDGQPVHIVCMIAAGRDQHVKHIQTLAHISRCLKKEETRRAILETDDPQFVYDCLVHPEPETGAVAETEAGA